MSSVTTRVNGGDDGGRGVVLIGLLECAKQGPRRVCVRCVCAFPTSYLRGGVWPFKSWWWWVVGEKNQEGTTKTDAAEKGRDRREGEKNG
jgi:hypothetical protein